MTHEDAVVLRLWDFSETSQTGALFTRGRGVVRCLAKGSKRPRAKFSGGLELLTRGEAVLIVKPGAELAQLIEWDLRETYFGLRRSIDAHLAGAYAADLVFRCVTDHDPHERLFDALVGCLDGVDRSGGDRAAVLEAVLAFQWATLVETGYTPSLSVDVRTGETLGDEPRYGFDPRLGGVIRDPGRRSGAIDASGADGGGSRGEVWLVRGETVRRLRGLASRREAPGRQAPGADDDATAESSTRCVRFLAAWITRVTGDSPGAQEAMMERLTRK